MKNLFTSYSSSVRIIFLIVKFSFGTYHNLKINCFNFLRCLIWKLFVILLNLKNRYGKLYIISKSILKNARNVPLAKHLIK
jgi:hypothetical protein